MATLARGHEAVYHNPAALADLEGRELTLGLVGAGVDLRIDGLAHAAPDPAAALVGVALPLPMLGWWEGRVGLALGVWMPTDVVAAAHVPALGTPWLPLVEERARTVGVHLAAGLRPAPWLSVGGGFLALAALGGGIRVRPLPGGRLTSQVEDELVADFAPIVGLTLGEPGRGLPSVALVYRGVSRADYSVPLDADLGEAVCLGSTCIRVPVMDISGTAQYDPAEVRLDVRRDLGSVALAAGVTWKRWSAYPQPARPPVAGSPPHGAPGFSDTVVPSLAAEWRALERPGVGLAFRLGAWHEPSPAPDDARPGGLLDAPRTVVAAGFGARVGDGGPGTVTLDAFGMAQQLWQRTQTTAGGERTVAGHLEVAGIQAGVRF